MKKADKIIKSSTHKLIDLNKNKNLFLQRFIKEWRVATQFFIDYAWNNAISFTINNSIKVFSIKDDLLDLPIFYPNIKNINMSHLKLNLSYRALNACATQSLTMIKSAISSKKYYQYKLNSCIKNSNKYNKIKNIVDNFILKKPCAKNIGAEVNSHLCDIKINNYINKNGFDSSIKFSAIKKLLNNDNIKEFVLNKKLILKDLKKNFYINVKDKKYLIEKNVKKKIYKNYV